MQLIGQTFTVESKGTEEPERRPTGGSDEPQSGNGSGGGGEAPIISSTARSGSEPDPLGRTAIAHYEWMHTGPPAGAQWKMQLLWFAVALVFGSVGALILLAFN
jgi:hypothetical protein